MKTGRFDPRHRDAISIDSRSAPEPRVVRRTTPWHFRLAKWLIRQGRFGGYHWVELAERLGWLTIDVRFTLDRGVTLDVPLDRRPNQWALPDLLAYERPLVAEFVRAAGRESGPVRWVDVGADIGALSALVASQVERIDEAWGFEPNPLGFSYLSRNFQRLPGRCTARRCAVGDYAGRGRLVRAAEDVSDHAMYLEPDAEGDLEVVRLDDLLTWDDGLLMLKVDVEGGELAVLQGAEQLLRRMPRWIVAFEAHRGVCRRTGIDPSLCLRWLQSLRKANAHVAECPQLPLDGGRAFFDQLPCELTVVNVVCRSDSGCVFR